MASCTAEEKKADGVPAAKVCASSLDAPAAQALDRLSRVEEFRDVEGPSFEGAVANLRQGVSFQETRRSSVCRVREARDTEGSPLFDIEFAHPGSEIDWPERLRPYETYYRVGLYGKASESDALIAFRCDGGLGEGAPPIALGTLHLWPKDDAYEVSGGPERGRLLMTILHAATRVMAEELGCRKQAGIPTKLPEPSDRSAYRKPEKGR
ncbi:hypothetical protein LRS74_22550 [Streptomyces sp. LX-29]|uniref:hypothetical protein n=1 Tax=Streptomyces sp. LX-29 TaxID=2900152 RepID=UPI00240D348E|nr:hypothetical protein [Streptomyces sp. LX-29]WFB09518.1 hypothetical protein LRS74_22550 [Streptomyces sp. LX-29]